LIEPAHPFLSIEQQCSLLNLSHSSYYYSPSAIDELTLTLLRLIDEEYTRHPFIGTRRMTNYLNRLGYEVNRKRIQGLYQKAGIEAVYPKPKTSQASPEKRIYPYLLRDVDITHNNQVWSTDITYSAPRLWIHKEVESKARVKMEYVNFCQDVTERDGSYWLLNN